MDRYEFLPCSIYNCDETGIFTVPNKPTKIISVIDKKEVEASSSAERGKTITAEIHFNALGYYIPVLIIMPGFRKNTMYERFAD